MPHTTPSQIIAQWGKRDKEEQTTVTMATGDVLIAALWPCVIAVTFVTKLSVASCQLQVTSCQLPDLVRLCYFCSCGAFYDRMKRMNYLGHFAARRKFRLFTATTTSATIAATDHSQAKGFANINCQRLLNFSKLLEVFSLRIVSHWLCKWNDGNAVFWSKLIKVQQSVMWFSD